MNRPPACIRSASEMGNKESYCCGLIRITFSERHLWCMVHGYNYTVYNMVCVVVMYIVTNVYPILYMLHKVPFPYHSPAQSKDQQRIPTPSHYLQ